MFSNENRKNSSAIASECKIHANFCLRANLKGTLLNRESISGRFFWHLMRPHDLLVMEFWLHFILMRIQDLAMSRSYAHFWSFYSWDHSLHHGPDPVSISPVESGQFLRSRSHRQYRDRRKLQSVPYRDPMFLGYNALTHAQRMFPWLGSFAWPQV